MYILCTIFLLYLRTQREYCVIRGVDRTVPFDLQRIEKSGKALLGAYRADGYRLLSPEIKNLRLNIRRNRSRS